MTPTDETQLVHGIWAAQARGYKGNPLIGLDRIAEIQGVVQDWGCSTVEDVLVYDDWLRESGPETRYGNFPYEPWWGGK